MNRHHWPWKAGTRPPSRSVHKSDLDDHRAVVSVILELGQHVGSFGKFWVVGCLSRGQTSCLNDSESKLNHGIDVLVRCT